MQKPGLREFMQGIYKLEEAQNLRCTMLGIGPMSENPTLRRAFLLAKKKDFPVMFIASRNQVDADEFGGGYVCSWNQDTFRRDIAKIAGRCRYDGLYYLCRDHGGPWQRDKERSDKLSGGRGDGAGQALLSVRPQGGLRPAATSTPTRSPTWATWSRWTWCSTSRSS